MKGDLALDLLHDLVDVAVEDGHRPKALEVVERARGIVRAPSPLRIDAPERDVCEDDNWRRRRAFLEVVLQPFELVVAEIAQAAGLEIDHVNEADEMHAVGVEAVPAGALRAAAIALEIELVLIIDDVMLARHVMHIEASLRDDAIGIVEFGHLGEMRDVAGMNDEGR